MERAPKQQGREKGPDVPMWGAVQPAVASYLGLVGIGETQDGHLFWERLRRRHGPIAEDVARAISAREEGQDVDVYALKNKTLALSIDVTAQYCNQMYAAFLSWFLRERFAQPASLLDIGCDNGILTCFYATVYPRAAVVGVDQGEQGIACARELAKRLELANVRFETGDLLEPAGPFPDQAFDLIVSTTVFHEILGFPDDLAENGSGTIHEVPVEPALSEAAKIVTGLVGLLSEEEGMMVSMERCRDAAGLAWWIRVLHKAGLRIMTDRSTLLEFTDEDRELQALPILVAKRDRQSTVSTGEAALAFQIYQAS